ncbi:MAG: SulP family inorganic anion transporter, partial [Pseudomonadota bacterium]
MTTDQIILFSLFGGVFAMLLWGRIRYDIVAFSALMIGVVLGVVPSADAFAGFSNAAIVIPQGVAFATIAGLPPEMGLYTA